MTTGCLYRLTAPNGKAYIGITVNARKRWWTHNQQATKKNVQTALGAAIRKHGFDSFTKEILVIGEIQYLKELETRAIEAYATRSPQGYNLTAGGDGLFNPSPEVRERMRQAQLGTRRSQDVKDRIGAAQKGRVFSVEHRAKITAANLGRVLSEDHLQKIKAAGAARRGVKLSEERRARCASPGALNPMYGKPGTRLGKPHSEETKRKISEAHRARIALRKLESTP